MLIMAIIMQEFELRRLYQHYFVFFQNNWSKFGTILSDFIKKIYGPESRRKGETFYSYRRRSKKNIICIYSYWKKI